MFSSPPSNAFSECTEARVQIDHIAVVVPAHDEEDVIVDCLRSIRRARRPLPSPIGCSIVVVANRCTDATVARALEAIEPGRGDSVVMSAATTVGAARQLGAEHALAARTIDPDRLWIANTDADTIVDPDWISKQLEFADRGIVGVAGIVELRKDSWCNLALVEAFDSSYSRGDGLSHPHVHGANLGFRGDAFRMAGGWRPLATGEDHDLWARLRDAGPVASSGAVTVSTSARTVGRAPRGFAANIAALVSTIEPVA